MNALQAPRSPHHVPLDLDLAHRCQRALNIAAADRHAYAHARRIAHINRAERYRRDYFSLARAYSILGAWEAEQTGAGGWGDLYADLSIPDAMALAREGWREELTELASLREDRMIVRRVV